IDLGIELFENMSDKLKCPKCSGKVVPILKKGKDEILKIRPELAAFEMRSICSDCGQVFVSLLND
ncbi:MAG: hypothetical protein ACFFG0_11545, partial [Candidatus Thorarchaeota archaeon]